MALSAIILGPIRHGPARCTKDKRRGDLTTQSPWQVKVVELMWKAGALVNRKSELGFPAR